MGLYENIKMLCDQNHIAVTRLESELGFARGSIGKIRTQKSMKADRLDKIADYFGVSVEYLLTGEEPRFYEDDETAQLAQKILTNPDLRALMQAAEDSTPEDMQMVADILKRMKATNPDG